MRLILVLILLMTCTLVKSQKDETYELSGIRKYTYNEKGERSHKLTFNTENRLIKKVAYFYDSRGHKIRTEKRLANDSLLAVYEYEFNEKNQKVSSEKTDRVRNKKSSKRYLYNDLGQNITSEYIANGKILKKVNYAYNNFGHQAEYLVYSSKDELSTAYYTENKYDEKGNLVSKFKCDKSRKLVKTNIYTLNKKAQISESLTIYHNGKRPNSKRRYPYDKMDRKTGFEKFVSIDHKE